MSTIIKFGVLRSERIDKCRVLQRLKNYGEIDQVGTYLEPKDAFRRAISSASLKFRRVKEVNEDSTIKNTMITGWMKYWKFYN